MTTTEAFANTVTQMSSTATTPAPYDRNLLAAAPVPGYETPTDYDVGLLIEGAQHPSQPPSTSIPGPSPVTHLSKEANETGVPVHPGVSFWRRKVGKIVIGIVVTSALILAVVGGSLGAAAAATVHRDRSQNSATFTPSINYTSSSTISRSTSTQMTSTTTTSTPDFTPPVPLPFPSSPSPP